MRAPAWKGDHWLSAGEYYSSGAYHGSWDVAMPSGTPVYAPVAGKVLDAVTGVPNVPGGSGSPSNWVTLGFMDKDGRKVSLYFQHLKDARVGLKGKWVQPGTLLGHSGNSGNSSGPHLHLTLAPGWATSATRYQYLNGQTAIYPPSKSWEPSWKGQPTMPLSDEDARKVARAVWAMRVDTKDAKGKGITKPASWLLQNTWQKVRGS